MKLEGAVKNAQKVPVDRGLVITKRPYPKERIGEVSGNKRACWCRGLVQLVSEELMEEKIAIDSHSRDCRGSERGHNRRVKEDAKENGRRKKFTDE